MPFFKYSLIATLLLLFLCTAFLAVACDVRDISLGKDPGSVGEPVSGNGAVDRDADMKEDAGNFVATGGASGSDAARYDGKNEWDKHNDRDYKDAEKEDVEIRRDSGHHDEEVDASIPNDDDFDASMQPVICGYSTCRPGYVCCESCQSCTLSDEYDAYCPSDCELPQPPREPCRECEQDKETMYCPRGTAGSAMCVWMDDGSCAWQPARCYPVNMPCGESIGDSCQAWEYCGAPECGIGDNVGYCFIRPSIERDCPRIPEPQEPVCGCDGNDYDNYCLAHAAGTNVAYKGTCQ